MTAPAVSVIVVSRGRPELLGRCLTGVGQLCYPSFEIVAVADPAGCAAVRAMGWAARLKLVAFDEPNISAARNAGLAVAAGEIVAFIDDDAVPEPSWLTYLTAPFGSARVAAAGGHVIGRNGISFQSTTAWIDALGQTLPFSVAGEDPVTPAPGTDRAAKTEGTNCAFRRATIAALGGFDPAIRFFHDETDLDIRLARAGHETAIVPLAQVHHGAGPSEHRTADRAPADLYEVGASTAVFWRKHAPDNADLAAAKADLIATQRARLLRYMIGGGLEPRDVTRLLAGLVRGLDEGRARHLAPLAPIGPAADGFLPFRRDPASGASRHLAGRPWNRATLRRQAARAVAAGDIVTVFRFSPTALPHHVRFHPGGWWEQRGGLFGRATRAEPYFRFWRFGARVDAEWRRVSRLRQCQDKT